MSNQNFEGIRNLLKVASPNNKKAAAAVNAAKQKWQTAAKNWTKKTTSNNKTRATVNAKANMTEIAHTLDLSKNEEDVRQGLIKMLDADFIKTFRDVKLPDAGEFKTAIQTIDKISGTKLTLDTKAVFGNTVQYNQDIADENYAFKEMFKLVIITLFGTSIAECEKELKPKPNNAVQKQLEVLKGIYEGMTDIKTTSKGKIIVPKGFNPNPVSFTEAVRLNMMKGDLENKMTGGNGVVALTNSLATPHTAFLHIPSTGMLPSGTTSSMGYIDPSLYVNQGVIPPYARLRVGTTVEPHVFNPMQHTQGAYKFNALEEVPPLSLNKQPNSSQPSNERLNSIQQNSNQPNHANVPSEQTSRAVSTKHSNRNTITDAQQMVDNSQRQHPVALSRVQQRGMAVVSLLYNSLGIKLPYNPLDVAHKPVVTDQMAQQFGLIREELRKLKETLSRDSSGRFEILQYYSFLNILERIHIGTLTLTEQKPEAKVKASIEVPANEITNVMIKLANYNDQYKDVSVVFVRKIPTTFERATAAFKLENAVKYAVEEINIFYTDLTDGLQHVVHLTPLLIESAFIPFAFRFLFNSDRVLDISKMMNSIEKYFTIEPSFAGFWSPELPTHVILARLKGANKTTKQIISAVAQFTKLASDLASYKHFDYLVSNLGKIVNDPGKSLEMRQKAAKIKEDTYQLVQTHDVWAVAMPAQLADMATQMAIVSGRLDETIKEDQVTMEFIQNVTSKFGNALKDIASGAAELTELAAKSGRDGVRVGNEMRMTFLNKETAVIFIVFLTKYLSYSTGSIRNACASLLSAGLIPVGQATTATIFAQLGNEMLQSATGGYLNSWLTTCTMIAVIAMLADRVNQVGPAETASYVASSIGSLLYQGAAGLASLAGRGAAPASAPASAPVAAPGAAPLSARRRPFRFGAPSTPRERAEIVANRIRASANPINLQIAHAHQRMNNMGRLPRQKRGGRRTRKRAHKKTRSTHKRHHRR